MEVFDDSTIYSKLLMWEIVILGTGNFLEGGFQPVL